ncbi:T9SS type A sorting domain-containing protein [bacterium]|nr:T9SS type A sorting domain-containing protein [bacterium]
MKRGLLLLSLTALLSLLATRIVKGEASTGYVHPSLDETSANHDSITMYLSGDLAEKRKYELGELFPNYFHGDLGDFNGGSGPLPPEDSLIYMYVDTTAEGYTQSMRRRTIFDTGADHSFPDCFLEAPGETSVALDVHYVNDSTTAPYLGSIFADCYPFDYPDDVQTMPVPAVGCLYWIYFNNLAFTHPPTHGDSVVVRVRKEHDGRCYLNSIIAEIDTMEYGGVAVLAGDITLKTEVTGIDENQPSPKDYVLQTFPNPFNSKLNIKLPAGHYDIDILNIQGKKVAELEGYNNVQWDASDQPGGVYFVRNAEGNIRYY